MAVVLLAQRLPLLLPLWRALRAGCLLTLRAGCLLALRLSLALLRSLGLLRFVLRLRERLVALARGKETHLKTRSGGPLLEIHPGARPLLPLPGLQRRKDCRVVTTYSGRFGRAVLTGTVENQNAQSQSCSSFLARLSPKRKLRREISFTGSLAHRATWGEQASREFTTTSLARRAPSRGRAGC